MSIANIVREFISSAKERFSANSYGIIKEAMRIAIKELAPYERYNGDPMLYHSIGVARIVVKEMGLGRNSAVSAILHDVIRLGHLSLEQVREQFGPECEEVLRGLTSISAVDTKSDSSQSGHFRDLIVSYSTNPRIILIKLADRLEVMRMLSIFPESKRVKKSWDTLNIYSQLAHKLGLYKIKTEMEDLSLKYLEPVDYENITAALERTKASREDFIERFIQPIKASLDKTDIKYSIKGRTKSVYSIWRKMKKQRIPFEEVYDVFAIRIILDSKPEKEKSDCWVSYSIVSDFYNPNTERMRDWISIPKSNGYESLHTTVVTKEGKWVEVQIRTVRMDEVAERGIAAHWRYKGVSGGVADGEEWLARLRAMMESVEIKGDSLKLDNSIDTSSKEIFLFTPNGDLRRLPMGATVLDFAFEIHSNLGCRCVGAKVNHRNVTIKEVLKNGDLVEIITGKNQKPKIDWLNIVVTSKARQRIKTYMREEQRDRVQLGREELERKLKNWKVTISLEESVNVLYKYYKCKSGLDFYGLISEQKVTMGDVKEVLARHLAGENVLRVTEARVDKTIVKKSSNKDALVIDQSLGNVAYKMAKCCNPVFGDDIFAFVTVGSGITIHRSDCLNAQQLVARYPYRVIDASWSSSSAPTTFSSKVSLICEDSTIGIEHSVRDVLKQLNVPLRSISMEYGKQMKAVVTVEVPSSSVLDSVVYRLGHIKGVVRSIRQK